MRKTIASFGMSDYDDCLVVEDVSELEGLCPGATVSVRGYMLGYSDMGDPAVTPLHRLLARLADGVVKMRVVRLDL